MKIKTDSGLVEINKRSPYGKFLQAYIETGAFSGSGTLAAAWRMANDFKASYPSLSWPDIGKMTGKTFKHKPSESYLSDLLYISN